jgi:hypothetical protein
MRCMNRQRRSIFIDDNRDSVKNQSGFIGFEIQSLACKVAIRGTSHRISPIVR